MDIKIISLTKEEIEERDYCDIFAIEINGEQTFKVHDGEHEDNSIGRNFNDVYKIPAMLKEAHQAGKNGEELNITNEEVSEY